MNNFYIRLLIYFICFVISLFGLSALDFNRFIRQGRVAQAQVLYFVLACAISYLFSQFLMSLIYYFY